MPRYKVSRRGYGCVGSGLLLASVPLVAWLLRASEFNPSLDLWVILPLLGLAGLSFAAGSTPVWPHLVTGGDGFRFPTLLGSRFVSWADVAYVSALNPSFSEVLVRLKNGESLNVAVSTPKEFVEVSQEKLEAAKSPRPGLPEFARVEAPEEWLAQARGLLTGHQYRVKSYSEGELVELAADARVSPEERIAATLALADASPTAKQQVRIGIEDTGNREVAEAMEDALSGKLKVKQLKRALADR